MKKLVFFFLLISPSLFAVTWTVGSEGDFADIQSAINNAAVQNGDTLDLQAETFAITTVISVTKNLTFNGQSKTGTTVSTSTLNYLFTITATDVTFQNFTAINTFSAAFTVFYLATASSTATFENLKIQTSEDGIWSALSTITVNNCEFVYDGALTNRHRFIYLTGSQGTTLITNNTFSGIYYAPTNRGSKFIETASTFTGTLVISNNTQTSDLIRNFIEWQGTAGGDFTLVINNNSWKAGKGDSYYGTSIGFYTGTHPLDLFSLIQVTNNTDSSLHGKGLISFDGYDPGSDLLTSGNPSLLFIICSNTLAKTTVDAIEGGGAVTFTAATGDGLIGYSDVFNAFHIALPPCCLNLKFIEERFPTQGDWVNKIYWNSPDSTLSGFRVYRDSLTDLISQSLSTTYYDHQRVPGIKYTYYVRSYDAFGNESRIMSVTGP